MLLDVNFIEKTLLDIKMVKIVKIIKINFEKVEMHYSSQNTL